MPKYNSYFDYDGDVESFSKSRYDRDYDDDDRNHDTRKLKKTGFDRRRDNVRQARRRAKESFLD